MLPQSKGAVHWSISALTKYPNVAKAILDGPYKKQALVPASPWLDNTPPEAPAITTELKEDKINITWQHSDENKVFRWVVYFKYGNEWNYQILNRKDRSYELKRTSGEKLIPLSRIAVSAVDRVGNESKLAEISGF
jgi:hypothetical protein